LRALRLDGNRAKRKRLRWQAANHGCHCFDRASYWLHFHLNATHATQAIAFGWKPGFIHGQPGTAGARSVEEVKQSGYCLLFNFLSILSTKR